MTLVSQSEYARRLGVTTAAVSQWKKANRLVMDGRLVDVEKSDAMLKKYRTAGLPEVVERPETVKEGAGDVKRGLPAVKENELNAPVALTGREVMARLAAMDQTQDFDWSPDALHARVMRAAECMGWKAFTSPLYDDGHWGGYQLRIMTPSTHPNPVGDGIAAGYGYELSAVEAIQECRDNIEPFEGEEDEMVDIRIDLLAALAYPIYPGDTRP